MNVRRSRCQVFAWGGMLALFAWLPTTPRALAQTETTAPGVTLSGAYPSVDALLGDVATARDGRSKLRTRKPCGWPRVIVYARDAPADTVLNGIATLFNYRWNGGRGYPAPAGETNTLAQTEVARVFDERLCREQLARGASALFRLAKYTRTPPDEWKKRLDALKGAQPDDPLLQNGNLANLAQPHKHAALELLDTLTPREQQMLLQDEEVTRAGGAISGRQWQLLQRMDQIPGPRYEWLPGEEDRLLSPKEVQANLGRKLQLHRETGLPFHITRDPVTGSVPYFDPWYSLSHLPPPPSLLPVRGNPYTPAPNVAQGASASPPSKPTGEWAAFPADFKLPVPVDGRVAWMDVMKALSDRLPQSFVLLSDDYENLINWREREARLASPAPDPPTLQGKTLEEGLDALCASQGRLWWRDGNVLHFRSQTWFLRQRYQVPPPILAQLAELAGQLKHSGENKKRTAEATAALLATLGSMTHQQVVGLLAGEVTQASIRQNGSWDAQMIRPQLRLFQTLDHGQQRQLLLGGGLEWHDLTPAQQSALMAHAARSGNIWITRKAEDIRWAATPYVQVKRAHERIGYTGAVEEAKEGEPRTAPGVVVSVMFKFMPNAGGGGFSICLPDQERSVGAFSD